MSVAMQRDIGAFLDGMPIPAVDPLAITAGGGGDGAEQSGEWMDRQDRLSGKLIIAFVATLAQDETLSIAANMQDASDDSGTGAADYGDAVANAVVATGGTGGSTERGIVTLDVDLSAAARYVRAQMTPTMSAASTDVATTAAVFVTSGGRAYPLS